MSGDHSLAQLGPEEKSRVWMPTPHTERPLNHAFDLPQCPLSPQHLTQTLPVLSLLPQRPLSPTPTLSELYNTTLDSCQTPDSRRPGARYDSRYTAGTNHSALHPKAHRNNFQREAEAGEAGRKKLEERREKGKEKKGQSTPGCSGDPQERSRGQVAQDKQVSLKERVELLP